VYYVRCATRSSGASAKGTPKRALAYISDAHDAERDPSYSRAELAYIARLDPGWKQQLEGGRIALVGLGALRGCRDQAVLAREFEDACQPWHDRRGSTGYLSYTFTMPKELSLVAEGHPIMARMAMYAALQSTLDAAFPGMEYKAVAAVHARNEAGEVHYHAHVLIGKFAMDRVRRRLFSLNSRSGGNTGKARVQTLKRAWKESLDLELRQCLGLVVSQAAPFAGPALTLRDGTQVPALNRESRRLLDKHLSFRLAEPTAAGACKTRNFRWTHFDATIYELAAAKTRRGWNTEDFCELFPELVHRLKTYEARVATLKRVGYLTADGRVTEAFRLHYSVHKGDHPELQRIRADVHKRAHGRRREPRASRADGRGPDRGRAEVSPALDAPEVERDDRMWDVLLGDQRMLTRLDRLGVSTLEFERIHEAAKREQPTEETLRRLRSALTEQKEITPPPRPGGNGKGIVRSYCAVQRAKVVSFFVLSKGLLTLRPGQHAALARRMMTRARIDYFYAKEGRLAVAARRLRPLFSLGRIVAPGDVERLELALRRVGDLPSRETAERFLRGHRWRLYANSREALIQQRRAEEQHKVTRDKPARANVRRGGDERGGGVGQHGGAAYRAHDHGDDRGRSPDGEVVRRLRIGMEVLRDHRPGDFVLLASWIGREEELLERLVDRAKMRFKVPQSKEGEATLLAYRVGGLLANERAAARRGVPAPFASCEREIRRANARMGAAGAEPPFSVERLRVVAVQDVQRAVGRMREVGILDDGPGWAVRVALSPTLVREVKTQVDAELRRGEEMER
jgi:hypothetical protein